MAKTVTYELQRIPRPGQLMMYIALSELKHMTIKDALTLLESMAYEPQLRYQDTPDGVKLYALLRDEQFSPFERLADDYRVDEKIALFEAFPGDEMAVFCPNGLPAKVAV